MTRRPTGRNRRVSVTNSLADPLLLTPFAAYRGDVANTATNFDWTDRTGNGHTLRQATGADKPSIVTPSEIRNQSALRFDGVSDYLAAIDAASNYTFTVNGSGVSVYALIIPRTALVAGESIVDTYTSGANTSFRLLFGATASTARVQVMNNAGAFAVDALAASAFAVGTPVLISLLMQDNASPEYDLRANNVPAATGSATFGTNAPPAALNVGRRANGTAFGEFDIAELVIFNRLVTPGENAILCGYFQKRYGRP